MDSYSASCAPPPITTRLTPLPPPGLTQTSPVAGTVSDPSVWPGHLPAARSASVCLRALPTTLSKPRRQQPREQLSNTDCWLFNLTPSAIGGTKPGSVSAIP